jgi:RHS repeat-associated protein
MLITKLVSRHLVSCLAVLVVVLGFLGTALAMPQKAMVVADRSGVAPVLAERVLDQMPARNGIPRKDDPPLVTDDGPEEKRSWRAAVADDLAIRELDDERSLNDCGDPVGLHNGMVSYRAVDLCITGRGLDFVLARRYDSKRARTAGPLGFGWDFSWDITLRFTGAGAELRNGNGRVDVFAQVDAQHFAPPNGLYARLAWDAVTSVWVLRTRHGAKTGFGLVPGDSSGSWRALWTEDANGNRIACEYTASRVTSVIDTLGRRIAFVYDADGRLERVRDFLGREVVYAYDATTGDLASVRSPLVTPNAASPNGAGSAPSGRTERYAYFATPASIAHALRAIVHPAEVESGLLRPYVQFEYETAAHSAFQGWVTAQTIGGDDGSGFVGGTIRYAYAAVNQYATLGQLALARVRTTVIDRRGQTAVYAFNENGNALSIREMRADGSAIETRCEYNADGEVTKLVRPEGNWEERFYRGGTDPFARGNTLRVDRHRGPRPADQDVRTVAFEWDPVFQSPLARTDERGFTTRWTSDWMEGSADPASPSYAGARIARELGLDEAAALAQVSAWLANRDVNGDGQRADVHGSVIAESAPIATLTNLAGAPQATAEGDAHQDAVHTATCDRYGQVTSETDAEENVTVYLYTSEIDADGDGVADPDVARDRDPLRGGYLRRTIEDVALPYSDPQLAGVMPRALATDIRRDCGPAASPAFVERTTDILVDRAGRKVAEIDPRGVRTNYAVDELDEVWQETRGADVSAASYRHGGCDPTATEDLSGQAFAFVVRTRRDANGRTLATFVQNEGDRPDRGAVAGFHETWFMYDILGRLRTKAEEYGEDGELAVWTWEYDPNGNLTSVIAPEGAEERRTWDERDLLVATTHGFGRPEASTETLHRDANGNIVEIVDNAGRSTLLVIDGFDRLVERRNAVGSQRIYTYDAASNVTSILDRGAPSGPSPSSADTSLNTDLRRAEYGYDERSRLVRIDRIDPRQPLMDGALAPGDGRVTTILEHDRLGRLTSIIDDDGEIEWRAFDGVGRTILRRDALGNRLEACFDDADHLVEITRTDVYPDGHTRRTWMHHEYDALGRRTSSTDALGHRERFSYDSRDNLVSRSDAEGTLSTEFVHGVAVNTPGNTERWLHDGLGRIVREEHDLRVGGTGAGTIDTSNPYDSDGRVVVERAWDREGRLVSVSDDRKSTTTFAYDALGRCTHEIAADGGVTQREFDGAGDLCVLRDARGARLVLVHDRVHRLTALDRAEFPASVVGTGAQRFEYDGLGRRTKSVDSVTKSLGDADDWTVTRQFDALGRITEEDQNGRVVRSLWRSLGERGSLTYPSGTTLTFETDALDRLVAIREGNADIARYAYAGADRVLARTLANGATSRWSDAAGDDALYCDAAGRALRVDHVRMSDGALLAGIENAFDRCGHRTSERRAHDAARGDNAARDSLGRLVAFERDVPSSDVGVPGAGHAAHVTFWTLDGAHDWRAWSVDGVAKLADVAPADEYTTFGSELPAHDAEGNLQVDDASSFAPAVLEYDCLNRLRRISRGASVVEHDYDAEGRRVRTRTSNVAGAPAVLEFVYDGWSVIEEHDAGGALARRYVLGARLDELVRCDSFANGTSTAYFALQSNTGNVIALLDASAHVLERVTYDAYGAPTFQTPGNVLKNVDRSDFGNAYLFAGRRYEPWILPLIEMRARVYSPHFGRFLQRDPIGAWGDRASLGNAYAYAASDPLDFLDPFGLESHVPAWLHDGLSWAGFIPGVGIGADIVDAGLYGWEGEWTQAGLAGLAAVPFFGDAFAGGRKFVKFVKVGEEVEKTKNLKKVGRDVIERLEKIGEHPHDLKRGAQPSRRDLFADPAGNLYRGNKDGTGFAERLWINIQELFE